MKTEVRKTYNHAPNGSVTFQLSRSATAECGFVTMQPVTRSLDSEGAMPEPLGLFKNSALKPETYYNVTVRNADWQIVTWEELVL